jgi:replicative DNA helicase
MFQIAAEFLDRGEAVAVFTLEMTAREVIGRMVSFSGRVRYEAITQPKQATMHDLARIRSAALKLAGSPLWIDDSANQGSDHILAEAERIRDSHGSLGLVVVDYLQLISGGRAKGESREQEVARASGGLKQLAKHLA